LNGYGPKPRCALAHFGSRIKAHWTEPLLRNQTSNGTMAVVTTILSIALFVMQVNPCSVQPLLSIQWTSIFCLSWEIRCLRGETWLDETGTESERTGEDRNLGGLERLSNWHTLGLTATRQQQQAVHGLCPWEVKLLTQESPRVRYLMAHDVMRSHHWEHTSATRGPT
jgi:hypothetical protein